MMSSKAATSRHVKSERHPSPSRSNSTRAAAMSGYPTIRRESVPRCGKAAAARSVAVSSLPVDPPMGVWTLTAPRRCLVDSAKSSTFVDVGEGDFNISYVDGSSSVGDYFTDVFTIGGATVQNLTMGLGLETNIAFGLLGVGYEINEASVTTTRTTYPNLPVAMMQSGLINSVAYSLWLNDLGRPCSVLSRDNHCWTNQLGRFEHWEHHVWRDRHRKVCGQLDTNKRPERPSDRNFSALHCRPHIGRGH